MKRLSTFILGLFIVTFAFGKSVTLEQASQVANKYLSATTMKAARSIEDSFSKSYNGITTYHVFNYTGGGFVVVSADDAVTPILAYSAEGFLEEEISSPEARYWLSNISKEIAEVVTSKVISNVSLAEWDKIINNGVKSPSADVAPLVTTKWNQEGLYNYYCPADAGASNGKVPIGCVSTTMGQIMKYYNFPATGVGKHSYSHGTYGKLSANYDTAYNFSKMTNTATTTSYKSIATLLYHAGVSVDMNYAADASGAYSESVPLALSKYFNYDNKTIALADISDYTSADWEALLKSELNASRPVYYSGSDPNGGHAWVCDGYMITGAITYFHMNWGWGGANDGYFKIGALNSGNGNFNSNNQIIYGIKPGNLNLIVRFTDLEQNNLVPYGPTFTINCAVIKGTPTAVKLYIDNQLLLNTTQTSIAYPWNTIAAGIGTHKIRVEAINATDTVSWSVQIGLSEWQPEASGFSTPERGIKYMHAVNSDVVWATASDERSGGVTIQEFTKTINGGATWTPGTINNCAGLEPAMIFALSKDTAYVPMFKQTGSKPQGIYVTKNGGTSWTQQATASFSDKASFPNVVHFFNKNDGFCMGDPIDGEYEIYTTADGGNTWTLVPPANIPDPLTGDYGVVGFYSAVGDKAWFGTNQGLIYRSSNKGLQWEVSSTGLGEVQVDVEFKDALHGLAMDKSKTGAMSETSDGGITWTLVKSTGYYGSGDFCYVPGTENTWVSAGLGTYYSFDGGHSWAAFPGTQTESFPAVDFINNQCGWGGSINTSATTKGMYKYTGTLDPSSVLNPVTNLTALPNKNSVQLSWTAPATTPLSYTIYRNDTLLKTNITSLQYNDTPVSAGSQDYCVTAVYTLGQSPKSCTTTFITLNIPNTDEAAYRVYPNPSSEIIHVITPARFNEVRLINTQGKVVYRNNTKGTNLHILTEGFEPGMYILQIYTGTKIISKKVSIIR